MKAWGVAGVLVLALVPCLGMAQDKVTLGWGRLFTNDALGDTEDRWHTGSYAVSVIRGTEWSGILPDQFGQIVEWRFRGETIAPTNLQNPDPADRRYAGTLSLGVHSQAIWRGMEVNLGADLVTIGPQTGINSFQTWVHRILGLDKPDTSNQIGNAFRPTLSGEVGRSFAMSEALTFRPFLAAQAGVETLIRAGGDLVIGHFGQQSVMLRDEGTGQRYRAVGSTLAQELSMTLGADVARVFSSAYLPEGGAAVASDSRTRLRAGLQWQGKAASVFYGITYLSPEFEAQDGGQVVGSINLNLRF